MGATKVTKNFSEIEREAEMADNIAVTRREEVKVRWDPLSQLSLISLLPDLCTLFPADQSPSRRKPRPRRSSRPRSPP